MGFCEVGLVPLVVLPGELWFLLVAVHDRLLLKVEVAMGRRRQLRLLSIVVRQIESYHRPVGLVVLVLFLNVVAAPHRPALRASTFLIPTYEPTQTV